MKQYKNDIKHTDDSTWRVLSRDIYSIMDRFDIEHSNMMDRAVIVRMFQSLVEKEHRWNS